MPPSRLDYRPDIDGLRAVAVLAVVFCHAGLGFPGGFVGVDVFFVISGYLITGLMLKDLRRGSFSFLEFWERRARRIAPALIAVAAASTAAGWFLLVPRCYAEFGRSVVGLGLFTSNVQFSRGAGYFDALASQKPLLHTWSLAVEEQFYLVAPVALAGVAAARWLNRASTLMAIATALSFGLSLYCTLYHPNANFYLLPTRAWELLVGALLAAGPAWRAATPARRELTALAGSLLILIPCVLYDPATPFPGPAAVPPVLGAALLIAGGGSGRRSLAGRVLTHPAVVFVGTISYSLYLWHWPLLAFARAQTLGEPPAAVRALLLVVSAALGAASSKYLEQPFRDRRLLRSRRTLFATAAAGSVALIAAGAVIYFADGFDGRLTPQARRFADTSERTNERFRPEPDLEDVTRTLVWLGGADAGPSLLVWGDSHAAATLPGFEAACRDARVTGFGATRSATAPIVGYRSADQRRPFDESRPFSDSVLGFVRSRRVRAVVLAARWAKYDDEPRFEERLAETADLLRDAGATVYFMTDVPAYEFDVPTALVMWSWRGRDLSPLALPASEYDRVHPFHASLLPKLEERGVVILDPLPVLRTRTGSADLLPCDEGGSFYSDDDHLSTYGALALKPLFARVAQDVAAARARLSDK